MRARTLGYIVAACTPVWLLALLAILGRSYYSPYAEYELGPDLSSHVLAYALPIRYNTLHEREISSLDPKALDEAASRWLKHYRTGSLLSFDPVGPQDDGTIGFRSEIEANRRFLIICLTRDSKRELNEEQWDAAARRISQVIDICEIAKYNTPQATSFSASTQSEAINYFDSIRDKLSPESVFLVQHSIQSISPNPDRIRKNALRLAAFTEVNHDGANARLPSQSQIAMMLTSSPREYDLGDGVNSAGSLLAESYRIAYQEEVRLAVRCQLYGLTAAKTNSEAKSGLP